MAMNEYSAADIVVLEGLEPVRMRPGMYIGDVRDGSGLHHLVWEVVGNSIDQHLARWARHLRVDVDGEWVTVEDDGQGIPTEDCAGRSALDVIFTTLHAGATWDGHFPHVHVADRAWGMGLAVVNALSERLEVESRRQGKVHRAVYERGKIVEPVTSVSDKRESGTRIRFRPDASIFVEPRFDLQRIGERLQELAWLNPLLDVHFQGATLPGRGGLGTWVRTLAERELLDDAVLSASRSVDDVWVDLALGWRKSGPTEIHAFVNENRVSEGMHIRGLWHGLGQAFETRVGVARDALRSNLIACVHVGMFGPEFAGPARAHLSNPSAAKAVKKTVVDLVQRSDRHPLTRALKKRLRDISQPPP